MTQFYSRVDTAFYGDVYSIPFSYAKKSEINVFINDELYTEWEFLNNSQIKLIEIPSNLPENSIVSIRRTTDISEKVVDYTNQSMLNKDNLNLSQDQLLYAVQELYDNNDQFEIDTYNVLQQNKEEVLEIQQEFEDEVNFKIKEVSEAASKINALEEAVDTAVTAASTATAKAEEATQQTETLISEGEQILANFTDQGEDLVSGLQNEADRITEQIKQLDKNIDAISSKVSLSMFDTILKDHILTYEQTKGWALQGTYVYKEAVAGSRYGYPDFYNKCVEEFENSELYTEEWTQPVATGDTTAIAGGDMVITASSTSGTTWQAYKAFDNIASSADNGWAANGTGVAGWWQVKFPYKIKITGLKYYRRYSVVANNAITGRFYTSSDKITSLGDEFSVPAGANAQYSLDIANIPSEGVITDTIYLDTQAIAEQYGGMDYLEITARKVGVVEVQKNPNGHLFYDISDKAQIDEIYNTNGIAWYYGIDKENERVFLPRTKWFIQPSGEITEVNTVNEAGLPNITGTSQALRGCDYLGGGSGAIYMSYTSSGANASSNANVPIINFDASRSNPIYGNSDTVQPPSINQLLYICVGNTNVKSAVTDVVDVTTTENDTVPLFTGMYFDFTPNNVSWLRGGEQANSGGIYTFTYNELVNILNGETKYGDLKVIDVADMVTGEDYSLYWKVNQTDMTFITPTAISNKALSGGVMGNGMTLGLTDGVGNNRGLFEGSDNVLHASSEYYGVPANTRSPSGSGSDVTLGVTLDPTKSGIIAEQSTSQLYFKVANAVQNLELLDAGEVLEAVNNVVPDNSSLISSYAFPSDKLTELTLGASGTYYTAPANGWYYIGKGISANQYLLLDNTTKHYTINIAPSGTNSIYGVMPVAKGDVVQIRYSATGTTNYFRFIYAQGEV